MIQMVRYYRMPKGSVVERHIGIAVVFGNWPARVLKHRGWTKDRLVCERVATEKEHEWLASCLRFQAFHYPSVEGLLIDEAQIIEPDVLERIAVALQ